MNNEHNPKQIVPIAIEPEVHAVTPTGEDILDDITQGDYKYDFVIDVHTETIPKGLNEEAVRLTSVKKEEPEWFLEFRLKAYRHWFTLERPDQAHLPVPEIDYQDTIYYAALRHKSEGDDTIDPEIEKTFDKLGIPLHERAISSGNMAVDAVMDSVSVKTTFCTKLQELGIVSCSLNEAVREHPDLVRKYLGKVVSSHDNYSAALNSVVFSDGSFVYIPKGVRCPMELSTHFRINAVNTGQFGRTLIAVDEGTHVSYPGDCMAPIRDENQFHAAIVKIIAETDAEVKYSTVQSWYPSDKDGRGSIYSFVTKRGLCRGDRSKTSWIQVETSSVITWKYPSYVLRGGDSVGEFYSVAVTNNHQQADTDTKMIHLGRNIRSTIVPKGISVGSSQNSCRGLVSIVASAESARNHSQCNSLLLSNHYGVHTYPYADIHNDSAAVEHEAAISKTNEDQPFYCNQYGITTEEAAGLIVNGYTREVMSKLPMEFTVEVQKLLSVTLEGGVG